MKIIAKIKKIKAKHKRGFTLLETLVAITVLLVSVAGPLEIAAQALFSAFYARDEITAYYLAAESIEYVKNARDASFLNDVFNIGTVSNDEWLKGLDACVPGTNSSACMVDATESFLVGNTVNPKAVMPCDLNGGCSPLLFDAGTGIWSYDTTDKSAFPSKFVRTLKIYPQPNSAHPNEEAIIEATVTWQGNGVFGGQRKVVLKGEMSNWERK